MGPDPSSAITPIGRLRYLLEHPRLAIEASAAQLLGNPMSERQ